MEVTSSDSKLRKQAEDERYAKRTLDGPRANGLGRRVVQLRAATCIGDLVGSVGKWETLTARGDEWSGHLTANWRLIVEFNEDETVADLIRIEDYH